MKNFGNALIRFTALAFLLVIPAATMMSATTMSEPQKGRYETGFAVGLSGAAASCDSGFASVGDFDFSAGLTAVNPWMVLAPSAELRIGASVALWRSATRMETSILAGIAKVPGIELAAPYGGCTFGFDFPIGRSGFAIRAETLAKIGGREYAVAVVNPTGTVRYVDAWAPALIDLQVGFRWRLK